MKNATAKQQQQFERDNTRAARLILTDPDAFGGDESLAVRWARMFLARMEGDEQELRKAA